MVGCVKVLWPGPVDILVVYHPSQCLTFFFKPVFPDNEVGLFFGQGLPLTLGPIRRPVEVFGGYVSPTVFAPLIF